MDTCVYVFLLLVLILQPLCRSGSPLSRDSKSSSPNDVSTVDPTPGGVHPALVVRDTLCSVDDCDQLSDGTKGQQKMGSGSARSSRVHEVCVVVSACRHGVMCTTSCVAAYAHNITVKPILKTTCIQRPPVYRDHTRLAHCPLQLHSKTSIQEPLVYRDHNYLVP